LWNLGYPIGFQYVFEVGAFVMAAYMVGWLGEIPLAAHQIALTLAAATYMAASGIAGAVTVRVGNYVGSADVINLKRASRVGYLLVAVFMSITAILFVLLRNILTPLFTLDAEVQQVTSGLLILAALFQLSDGLQVVGLSILRGMKDVKFPTIIAMVSYWLIGIPVAYVVGFVFNLGVDGVWIGLASGLTASALFMYWRYDRQTRKFQAHVLMA
jgi:MATE family multidrug resistance protein